jgi:hypothetical protein
MFYLTLICTGHGYQFEENYESMEPFLISAVMLDLDQIGLFDWSYVYGIEFYDRRLYQKVIKVTFVDRFHASRFREIYNFLDMKYNNIRPF